MPVSTRNIVQLSPLKRIQAGEKVSKKSLELLCATRELLSDKSRWTQWQLAKDEWGHGAEVLSSEAKRWCLIGALMKCQDERGIPDDDYRYAVALLSKQAFDRIGTFSLPIFNDNSKYEDVIELLDHAILECKNKLCRSQ